MPRPRALVAWSTGGDSAWALYEVLKAGEAEVVGLLTTVTSMHAVREELPDQQAKAVGLPSHKVRIPWPCSKERYEAEMARAWRTRAQPTSATCSSATSSSLTRLPRG